MESKKRFGEYICHRRKELGLTQREFADKLYVTESAVSKWERGLSYPDVTLLRDICAVLDVSEHELLTASVDTERRTAERLAEKYLRLTRTYRAVQYVIYGAVLLGCAVGNLAVQGTLSWFWVALPAVLLAASLTLVPALAGLRQELAPCRASIALGCALASLELLLGACCLYTGGDWLWRFGIPLALVGLSLPWGLMALGRYLPATAWGRASLCFLWAGLWTWLSPWVVDRIMQCNGWNDDPYRLSWPFAFSQGLGPVQTIGVVVLVLWFVAAALALAGFMAARRRR